MTKETKIRSILVPVDYSENSDDAIIYAMEVARQLKCQVIFLHVFPATRDKQEEAKRVCTDVLERYVRDLFGSITGFQTDHIFTCVAVTGDPAAEVTAAAAQVDLVIMGLKGSNLLGRSLIGGVAWKVVSASGCPVITVPFGAKYNGSHAITFASDYHFHDVGALQVLAKLAAAAGTAINVIHIKSDGREDKMLGDWFTKKVSEYVLYSRITFTTMEDDNVIRALEKFSRDNDAGMIAFSIGHRPLLDKAVAGLLSSHFMSSSRIPLMFFRNIEPVDETEL